MRHLSPIKILHVRAKRVEQFLASEASEVSLNRGYEFEKVGEIFMKIIKRCQFITYKFLIAGR